jgi:hypothetical protein
MIIGVQGLALGTKLTLVLGPMLGMFVGQSSAMEVLAQNALFKRTKLLVSRTCVRHIDKLETPERGPMLNMHSHDGSPSKLEPKLEFPKRTMKDTEGPNPVMNDSIAPRLKSNLVETLAKDLRERVELRI